jgi:hypothetical protein
MADLRLQFDVYSVGRAFHADDNTVCPHGVSLQNSEPAGRLGQVVLLGVVKCRARRPLGRIVFDPTERMLAEPNPDVQEKPGDRPAVTLPADVRELLTGLAEEGYTYAVETDIVTRAAELLAKYRGEG